MNKSNATYIYELRDPRTNEVKYVGKSNNPEQRLRNHFATSVHRLTPKALWMQELRELGLKPELSIVLIVPKNIWGKYERALIKYYRDKGIGLLNRHKGGGGGTEWDEEKRELYREMMKALWQDPKYRAKVSEAIRQSRTPEFLEEQRERTIELWQDPEYREKVSEAVKASWQEPLRQEAHAQLLQELWNDEAYIKRWREGILKGWDNQDRRDQLSERNKEFWSDSEHREKWIKGVKQSHQTKEHRQKMSEITQGRWNDPIEREKLLQSQKPLSLEERKEIARRNKELWNDPEHREKRCKAISESWTPERRAAQAERIRELNKSRRKND